MAASLFKRLGSFLSTSETLHLPAVPDGVLVYAVGDIHGRCDLLRALLRKIADDVSKHGSVEPTVVFLGDYVDRGPDSRGVLEVLLRDLPHRWNCRLLKGNHEEAVLNFLRDPGFGEIWRDFGGLETMASYGVTPARRGGEIDWPRSAEMFRATFPPEHEKFLSGLSLYEQIGDYVFVHAGVRPGIPLQYQSEHDLLWIREEFTQSRRALAQTIIYGHTPSENIVVGPGRIGIDTGAYITGKLSAVGLCGRERWHLST